MKSPNNSTTSTNFGEHIATTVNKEDTNLNGNDSKTLSTNIDGHYRPELCETYVQILPWTSIHVPCIKSRLAFGVGNYGYGFSKKEEDLEYYQKKMTYNFEYFEKAQINKTYKTEIAKLSLT